MNALAPDLIKIVGRSAAAYADLSKIAPTIDVSFGSSIMDSFQQVTLALGTIIGNEEGAVPAIAEVEDRVAALKEATSGSGTEMVIMFSAGIVLAILMVVAWRNHVFDAMMLGRASAISIGVNYHREVMIVLAMTSVLVSVSTALVGPITFFGLLVAHLAYRTIGSAAHRFTIPAAALYAISFLLGGQLILEHVFTFNSSLSVMVEFAGGLLFLFLLLKGSST